MLVDLYIPRFSYTYTYEEKQYKGDSYNVEKFIRFYDKDKAKKFVDQIVSSGFVYVDKNKPDQSVVCLPKLKWVLDSSSFILVSFIVFCIYLFLI